MARARAFAKQMNDAPLAIIDKRRTGHNMAESLTVIGDVAGRTAILIDDMIDTGGTICAGARLLREQGAKRVLACATHAVFSPPASERLSVEGLFEQVVVTNSIPIPQDRVFPQLKLLSVANMLGYWRRPDLTEQTLRDGWMWTGDIATWDEEGYVFIVDRAKDMIISGGENIYSTQVEAAIHQHPAVLESAVFGIPDDTWGEADKAVLLLKPGQTATEEEIIAAASNHLASYQTPKSVDFVEALPKAPTGKILKRDLRDPYWQDETRQV